MRRVVPLCAVLLALGGAAANVAPATAASSPTAVLYEVGSSGPRVAELKHSLDVLGHLVRTSTNEYFGSRTEDAVRAFQRARGLPATGKVTRMDWDAIAAAVAGLTAATQPVDAAAWQDCTLRLDGVGVTVERTRRTQTIVNGTGGSRAVVSFFARTDSACGFERIFSTAGRVGYGGIADGATRRQGTGTTPAGTYTMTEAFGHEAAPVTAMPYRVVQAGDWWVQDNGSAFYNTFRPGILGGFATTRSGDNGSELLTDYRTEYAHAVVIDFNRPPDVQARRRGAGIFLHVHGTGATAGCVSIAKGRMETVLSYLKPGDRITIVP